MTPLLFLVILMISSTISQGVPSPGYRPSSLITTQDFNQVYRNQWGPQHQTIDQGTLTIWLDRKSGSGFKSLQRYRSGYFGADIKLDPGYTAGVNTNIYLSNAEDFPGHHDEVDIEFLGTTLNEPYVLQTNVYIKGSGDGKIIGRENQFHLWFDPTQDFHTYAVLWTANEIIFLVDDVPIRRYARKSDDTFPLRPMSVYGSIWDASSWATDDGKYKADYRYQPFTGKYRNFRTSGCPDNGPASCRPLSASPSGNGGLSLQQVSAMNWVQQNYLVYDYCRDPTRDHSLTSEC